MKAPLCHKCEVQMEKGFFISNTGFGHIGETGNALNWSKHKERSKWKIETLETIPTFQYRCPECGLVETYAIEEEAS